MAEDRTILANERTFAGWMRTSLACIGLGIGFNALFQNMQPLWIPRSIATAFFVLGIMVVVAAERRAASVTQRLSAHVIERAKSTNMRLFAAIIALGAAALIYVIWFVEVLPR